jgi:DNA mismatch endonuclease (patch repair protein)
MIRSRKKPGHRSWRAGSAPAQGLHVGDTMSVAKRSALMSRIRGSHTLPERLMAERLRGAGLSYEQHARDLPGRPDFVFREAKLALFVDGDFWHGWRFPLWRHKLAQQWQLKIEATRRRDQRNFRLLRKAGWRVVRIWEHQIESNLQACVERIHVALSKNVRRKCKQQN